MSINKNENQKKSKTKTTTTRTSSYYILGIIGLLLLVNIILIIMNIRNFQKEVPYKILIIVSLIGLSIGIYGLIHLGTKKVYYYNPLLFLREKVFNKKQKKYKNLY